MVLAGVSSRNVSRLAEEVFGAEVSPSLVSQLVKDPEPAVEAFRTRPLETYPYLIVDARFDKVRDGHRVRSRAFLWAAGVNEKGEREVLGWLEWGGETEMAREALFKDLKARRLKGVDTLVSDAHEGLRQTATKAFPGSSWQECQAHFLRKAIEQVKTVDQKAFRANVRAVLHAADRERGRLSCWTCSVPIGRRSRRRPWTTSRSTWTASWRCWTCRRPSTSG